MKFRLITPEKVIVEAEMSSVTLPAATGEITILPGHVPLVAQLGHGEMVIRDDKEHTYAVAGGFVTVNPEGVQVLAESADHTDEIDSEKAEAARAQAEKLREAAQSEEEIAVATGALERALAQLKVAGRKRKHHTRLG